MDFKIYYSANGTLSFVYKFLVHGLIQNFLTVGSVENKLEALKQSITQICIS